MMNNPSSNTDEKKCEYCGSNKTYTAVTRGERLIQNGIAILSKRIPGYAANVTGIFCITRPFLQFMFVEVLVRTELQSGFVINVAARQQLKKVRPLLMTIIYGIGIPKY